MSSVTTPRLCSTAYSASPKSSPTGPTTRVSARKEDASEKCTAAPPSRRSRLPNWVSTASKAMEPTTVRDISAQEGSRTSRCRLAPTDCRHASVSRQTALGEGRPMLKHILPVALAVSLLGPAAAAEAHPVSVIAYARDANVGRTFSVDGTPQRTFLSRYVPVPAHGDINGDGVDEVVTASNGLVTAREGRVVVRAFQ